MVPGAAHARTVPVKVLQIPGRAGAPAPVLYFVP